MADEKRPYEYIVRAEKSVEKAHEANAKNEPVLALTLLSIADSLIALAKMIGNTRA